MTANIFEFSDYRAYLKARLNGTQRTGAKGRLVEQLGIKASYLSRVLQEQAHLSLEQAEQANIFFAHNTEESKFFLLMLQHTRAGTHTLKKFFKNEMDFILQQRTVIKNRIQLSEGMSPESRAIYYSSWIFCAVHMALTLPQIKSSEDLQRKFNLPPKKINDVLGFLEQSGLIQREKSFYKVTAVKIHLSQDSAEIIKHHTQWRLRSIDSLNLLPNDHLHYSGAVTLSLKDIDKIKEILLTALTASVDIIQKSPEEKLYALCMDFFEV